MYFPLPDHMHAIRVIQPGGAENMVICEVPLPQVAPGQVLVKVMAASINRQDIQQRKGIYPIPPGASEILGLDIAGYVVKVGAGVTQWRAGDSICALTNGGGYAEYCAVPAAHCLPVPQGLDFNEAASLPEACFTVWTNLFDRAHLQPGESLLVQGGGSGIGVTAIQLASALGIRVFATAGSDEKCSALEKLGAKAINYRTVSFSDAVMELTAGRGVDVILDIIGGDYVPRELNILADDGRLVLIALMSGKPEAQVDLAAILKRRLTLMGNTLRTRSDEFKAVIAAALRERVWPIIETGQFQPIVHALFPLAEVRKAHELMESSGHIGKIVLRIAPVDGKIQPGQA